MKSLRVMSIIGIILFSICLIAIGNSDAPMTDGEGAGALAVLYAIPFAIVGLVVSGKKTREKIEYRGDYTDELQKLFKLRESGVISEDEFEIKKREIWNKA